MNRRGQLGRAGENIAAAFLVRAGFTIIERNWRCARGEIDIIAREGETVVFVEVKTRSSLIAGHPFEAITPAKLARLRYLVGEWCRVNRPAIDTIRLDAIAVLMPANGPAVIDHLSGVSR